MKFQDNRAIQLRTQIEDKKITQFQDKNTNWEQKQTCFEKSDRDSKLLIG